MKTLYSYFKKYPIHWLVFACGFLLYANTIFNEYNLDDELVTTVEAAKPHRLTSRGISAIPDIFTEPYYADEMGYKYDYRPLVLVTFAIEHSLFGDNPHISHFINALLYALICVLLYTVSLHLFQGFGNVLPVTLALVFAAYPLHTEVVASIKNRDEMLAFMGGMGALHFFLNYVERNNYWFLLAGAAAFALGLLAKQTVISFFILIPVLLVLFRSVSFVKIAVVTVVCCICVMPMLRTEPWHVQTAVAAGAFLFVAILFEVRYHVLLPKLMERIRNYSVIKPVLQSTRTIREHTFSDSAKAAGVILVLLTATAALLIAGSRYYQLPVVLLIPAFLFLPFQEKWRTPLLSGAVAIYLTWAIGEENIFQYFFLLFIYHCIHEKKFGKAQWITLLACVLLFIVLTQEFPGYTFLLFIGAAALHSYPAYAKWLRVLLLLHMAIPLISEFFTEEWKRTVLQEALPMFILSVLIFFLPMRKMVILTGASGLLLFYMTLGIHRIGLPVAERAQRVRETIQQNVDETQQSLKRTLEEAKNKLAESTRKQADTLNLRPVDYIESVTNSNSSFSEKLGTGMAVVWKYIRLSLIPYPMSFYYGYKVIEVTEAGSPVAVFTMVLLALLLATAFMLVKRNPVASAALFIFLLTLLPVANIFRPMPGMMADRFLFFPSLGFCLLAAYGISRLTPADNKSSFSFRKLSPRYKYVLLPLLLIYSGITLARNAQWRTPLTLMRHDISHLEKSAQAHNLLAAHLVKAALESSREPERQKLLQEAEVHYRKATEIYPDFFNATYDLGRVSMMLGKTREAEIAFTKVLKMDTTFAEPLLQLALINTNKGDYREAIPYYEKYLKKMPRNTDALVNLSFCYALTGDLQRALYYMKRASNSNPNRPEPLINLSKIFLDLGRPDSARYYLYRAEKIAPGHPDIPMLKSSLN